MGRMVLYKGVTPASERESAQSGIQFSQGSARTLTKGLGQLGVGASLNGVVVVKGNIPMKAGPLAEIQWPEYSG
jgi:hypothetical protein